MLVVVAKLKATAGKGSELAERMAEVAVKVRTEAGNRAYSVHQAKENGDLVMIFEQYDDQAALEAHRAHMKDMRVDLSGLLEGRPDLEYYETWEQ